MSFPRGDGILRVLVPSFFKFTPVGRWPDCSPQYAEPDRSPAQPHLRPGSLL